jgi:spore maturation protein CgeB
MEQERERFGSDIAFIGTWSRKREKFIEALLDYDVQVWGNMWNRANADVRKVCTHEAVYGEDFSKVCNSSKIVVDVLREQMVPSHSMKCFEIPACGAFFTCNPGHELDQFYDIGEEIVTFETPGDLQDRVDYYLDNDEERTRITDRARDRVQEYTYERRAKTILDVYTDFH